MHEPAAVVIAAVVGLAVAGCGGRDDGARRARLVDGSRSAALPTALSGQLDAGAVVARVRILRADRLDTRNRACVQSFRSEFTIAAGAVVVERTGAIGGSLTFVDVRRRVVLGCDRTGSRGDDSWCARSVGRLVAGALEDPRLDILCVDRRDTPVGFAWLEPVPDARWVVVAGAAGADLEPVAAGLPIRVATRAVHGAASSATFAVTEYDARGDELVRYRLLARVAG